MAAVFGVGRQGHKAGEREGTALCWWVVGGGVVSILSPLHTEFSPLNASCTRSASPKGSIDRPAAIQTNIYPQGFSTAQHSDGETSREKRRGQRQNYLGGATLTEALFAGRV